MSRLLIIGAGGHGVVVAEAAAATGQWGEILFLDDDTEAKLVLDFPVAGPIDQLGSLASEDAEVIVAIGNNRKRLSLCNEMEGMGIGLATVVHPGACISPSAAIGPGSVICAGAVVNARASFARACILNTGATVDHDCVIEEGVHISPGANLAGNVTVGACSWIGIGSAVREGITIADDVIAGAGSAIVADVSAGETVGGVPAKRLDSQ